MKKIITLFILMAILLGGCSLFSRQEEIPPTPPAEVKLEKKIGLVSTAEAQEVQNPLTPHMLVTETGEKFFIESVSVNLKRYVKRRVAAEGRLNDEKTVFLVESVTSLGNETQVKDLYQNASFGLKFQYPSLWSIRVSENIVGQKKILITPYEVSDEELETVDAITIERSENNKRLSPREFLGLDEQYRSSDPVDTAVYQKSSLGSAALEAVKKTRLDSSLVEFFVSRDTYIYRFAHRTQNDADKDLYKNAFFELVASFEFIPFGKEEAVVKPAEKISPTPPPPASLSELATPVITERKETEEKARLDAEAAKASADLAASRKLFTDYIEAHIFQLIPDPQQLATGMTVLQIEFVAPENEPENFNAVYVVYDYSGLKKVLLSVSDRIKPESMTRLASYKRGETQDWELIEGMDTVKGSEKTIVKLNNGESSATVVKKGMTLLDAKSFKVKIQYPSSWYWAYQNKGYSFSDKPVSGANVLIYFIKDPTEASETFSVCVQKNAQYCLNGDQSYEETIKAMLETIEE